MAAVGVLGRAALLSAVLVAAVPASAAVAGAEGTQSVEVLPYQSETGEPAGARVADVVPQVVDVAPRVEDVAVARGAETEIVLGADVLFAFGSAELSPAAREQLTGVVGRVREATPSAVRIEGHTDSIGSDADNQQLSDARAAAVRAALGEALGPEAPAFEVTGFGESQPVAEEGGDDDYAARALNRRVTNTLVP